MKKYLNLSAFIAMIAVNALAAFGILGGMKTQEVSALFPSILTPADMTFSIWSVIYLAMAGLIIWQMFDDRVNSFRDDFTTPFVTSCVLNILWIFMWQFRLIGLSFAVMVFLLTSLLYLMSILNSYDTLIRGTIGFYSGWINIALYANLAAWIGLKSIVFAIILIAISVIQISLAVFKYKNFFYGLAASWGILGMAIANQATSLKLFQLCCVMSVLLMIVSVIFPFFDKHRKCGICN